MFTLGIARREIRVRCDYSGPVDRSVLCPNDDKMRHKVELNKICHCEEGVQVTDAAIHRVSRITVDLSVRLPVHSGSPRTFSPRDDKVG